MPNNIRLLPIVLLLATPISGFALDESGYRPFDRVREHLERTARERPELVTLETIGRSAGGRPLLVARIAAAGTVEPDRRPAVVVGANIAGYHNAGTEAALHLFDELLGADDERARRLLAERTFYLAPVLNPDAHDGMFTVPRRRIEGHAGSARPGGERWPSVPPLDRDLDGLSAEDAPDDLNADGRITRIRVPDPEGDMLPDPDDPRVMVEADPLKGRRGTHRVVVEGRDDDGDGRFNEDGRDGVHPDRNFAHAYEYDDPRAGPWPGWAPETRSIMDWLLGRRNVAAVVIYGPANNLLALPQGFGGGGDTGSLKFKVPRTAAEFIGVDPEQEYTLDEIWELVKDLPFVIQNNITKEQLAQFLGAGPATKVDDGDIKYLEKLSEDYKKRLEDAGLDTKRSAKQYGRGGLTPWLYYQYGSLAIELDVWGVPKAEEKKEDDEALTLDRLEQMSVEQFLALDEQTIAAFLKDIGAPPQFTAQALRQRVESGQATPKQMAQMAKRMGAGGGEQDKGGPNDLMVFVDAHAPEAFVPWTKVTLPDGTEAEVGGADPFADIAPPPALLAPALAVHTETVLDLADRLAHVGIVELDAEPLGGGVYRVEAVAANRGFLPTHTKMAERARTHLPVRLEILPGDDATLVTGSRQLTAERLEGGRGALSAEWLVRVSGRSAEIVVQLDSENAGAARQQLVLGGRGR